MGQACLLDGAQSIKIHGQPVEVRAHVEYIDNLSAHADSGEILTWLSGFDTPPTRTFITHGEPDASDALRVQIQDRLKWECSVPEHMEKVSL